MKSLSAVVTLVLLSAAAATQPALADEGDWYVGLGAGRAQSKLDDAALTREVGLPGFGPTAVFRDDHGDAFKGFAGYRFSNYFALEGSYFDLGRFTFSAPTAPTGVIDGKLLVRGFGFDVVGRLPLGERAFAFAKIGVTNAQTRDTFVATPDEVATIARASHWHTNPKAGVGLQFAITPHFAIRGEWERYRISDSVADHGNVDAWFASLVFPLGHAQAQPVAVAKELVVEPPPPVVAAAPPPPPPPPPAPPPPPRRVNFSADALFSFNSAAIHMNNTGELDKFVAELRGTTFDRIRVVGYTDRIGSEAYNLRLSRQRADAVAAYLTTSGGISASKIVAEGRGEADPVTKPGDCPAKRTAATIACLQPDRRVEIEVAGTQH